MSELIAMRQRIKAIETIKKVTHAMRLISMSSHARLRNKKVHLNDYKQALINLISEIWQQQPDWKHPVLTPQHNHEKKELVIVIGSQKGLCGTFNASLFNFIKKHLSKDLIENAHAIVVGKKAVDSPSLVFDQIAMKFSDFTQSKLPQIAQKIADHIWHTSVSFKSFTILYNYPKTFFLQKPEQVQLIPFDLKTISEKSNTKKMLEDFHWEQDSETILDFLAHKLIQSIIQEILLNSLIAEQASRFIAMDNSTRNATNLLDATQLAYNKTRQAKITREITDLVASFQDNFST